jgi:hypothetical protein
MDVGSQTANHGVFAVIVDSDEGPYHPIYQYITRTKWLQVEDALAIGKLRLFAGSYQRGQGAQTTAFHYLDVADARVLFADVAAGAPVDYCDFKGTPNSEGPQSRVFKVKSNGNSDKVWFRLKNGPGRSSGRGPSSPGRPASWPWRC